MNLKDNKALVLFFFVVISLLIHLFFSFFFLEFGFKTRVKSIVSALSPFSALLSEKEIQVIQQQKAEKRKALQNVFEAMRKDKQAKPKFALFDKSKDTRPAKLVAPRSNFGWVIFDDNHKQPDKLEIPTTKDGDVAMTSIAHATELNPENAASQAIPQEAKNSQEPKMEQKHPVQAKATVKEADPKADVEKNMLSGADGQDKRDSVAKTVVKKFESKQSARPSTFIADELKLDEVRSDLQKQVLQIDKKTDAAKQISAESSESSVQQESVSVEERIKKIEEMQQKVEKYKNIATSSGLTGKKCDKQSEKESLLSSVLKNGKAKHSTGVVWGASNMKSGKSRNVIALTKGYIEKLDGENGTDLIDRDGDPNKKPDFEEMKYISYEAKLNWSCQATWKQNCNFYNLPMFAGEYRVVIGFTIGEKGELVKSEILESSGNKLIDSAVVKNLEFTAPFPPLPKHFGTTAYSTGRVVHVSINKIGF